MFHVFLDTTVLRGDPERRTAAFQALSRLAKAGSIKIHLSAVTVEEFISQELEIYSNHVEKLGNTAKALGRRTLPDSVSETLRGLEATMKTAPAAIEKHVRDSFEAWVAEVGATIHPLKPEYGQRVVESYFSGAKPFKRRKSRDDFPDAFIWQSIVDLQSAVGDLDVVSQDDGMQKACDTIEAINAFSTLGELISEDDYQGLLKEHYSKDNACRLASLLVAKPEPIEAALEVGLLRSLPGTAVVSDEIPGENQEASILSIGSPELVELDLDGFEYYGDGLFVIPFTTEIECLFHYAIFKADYLALEEERSERIGISELNDHFFDAEQYFSPLVQGVLSVQIAPGALEADPLSDDALLELLDEAHVAVDSIKQVWLPS